MIKTAKIVLKKLIENGYEAYFVGGFVRDKLMGNVSSDIDIATNARAEEVINLFDKTILVGVKHGTVTVLLNKFQFEVTTFRTDGEYLDNRRPESVEFVQSIEEDLSRRDFTMNALALDYDDQLIDLFKGKEDIENGLIKCVGQPQKRFAEDGLRILRAIRFVSKLGFSIDKPTYESMKYLKNNLSNIPVERLKIELDKIIKGTYKNKAFKILHEMNTEAFSDINSCFSVPGNSIVDFDFVEFWAFAEIIQEFNLDKWKLSKNQLKTIYYIKGGYEAIDELTMLEVYKYGLTLLTSNKLRKLVSGDDFEQLILNMYNKLPIKSKSDLLIDGYDIIELGFSKRKIGLILDDLEQSIVLGKLLNNKKDLTNYIRSKYND